MASPDPGSADENASLNNFFLGYTMLLLGLVIVGFAPSLYARFAFDPPPIPIYLHIHGMILTGWFAVLVLQAGLIRTGRTGVHRKLGYFAAAYAVVVVAGSLMATLNAVPRDFSLGLTFETNMAEIDEAMGGELTYLAFISRVIWANILSIVGFAILVGLAILLRRNVQVHKRLIVIATAGIMGPALARISRAEFLGGEQGPFIPLAALSLLLLVLVYDLVATGRIHRASLAASALTIVLMVSSGFVAGTDFGLDFVRSLADS